jgi:hypothetical protein
LFLQKTGVEPLVRRHSSNRDSIRRSELVVGDVARIASLCRLENDDLNFLFGGRPMFNASWHNEKLASTQFNFTIAKLHSELSLPYQKQLVLLVMVMPNKLTLELDELDFLTVKFGYHLRPPMLAEDGELLV